MHDATFKQLFSDRKFIITFCQVYLPENLSTRIDWRSLEIYKLSGEMVQSHTSEKKHSKTVLKKSHHSHLAKQKKLRTADVIYLFKYDQTQEGMLIFHCEQQSKPQKLMPLRMMNYISSALLDYAKINRTHKLPAVIPVLYYTGSTSPYPYSLDIYDAFVNKTLATKYLLHPILIDLGQYNDAELLQHGYISPAEIAFRHVFDKEPCPKSAKNLVIAMKAQWSEIDHGEIAEVAQIVIEYSISKLNYDMDEFVKDLTRQLPEFEGDIMTMAQQLVNKGIEQGVQQGIQQGVQQGMQQGMQQGVQQGMQEGMRQVAINMLRCNDDINHIARVTNLKRETIEALAHNMQPSEC